MPKKPKEPEYRDPAGFPGLPPTVRRAGDAAEAPQHIADPVVQAEALFLQTQKNRLNHPEIDDRPLKGWRRANPRR